MNRLSRRTVLATGLCMAPLARAQAESGFEWRPWSASRRVPEMDLPALDGARWRVADRRGRVLLANFWASWCEPCRSELPSLVRLAQEQSARGLEVAAVNYRESEVTVRRFLERTPLAPLAVVMDRDGSAATVWTPRIFPSTVVFNRAGRPAGVLVGEIDWQGPAARDLLEPLLAEKVRASRAYDAPYTVEHRS